MLLAEVVYIGRDNTISLGLSVNGAAIQHNQLTRVQVLAGTTLIDSATAPGMFDLTQPDRITLKFGQAGLAVGNYFCWLVIFDTSKPNGLVSGNFMIEVRSV